MTTGTPPSDDGRPDAGDTPMTALYVAALVVEVVIVAALWALGRMYS